MSYSNLIGVSRLDKAAVSFHLDPRGKPEDDREERAEDDRKTGNGREKNNETYPDPP